MFIKRALKIFLISLVAFALATVTYAYAASNTMPTNANAGDGSSSVGGYAVTSVVYHLNATNPQNIDSVSFTLNPTAASTVTVKLVTTGSWITCTNTSGSVSCLTPGLTVAAVNTLVVVAVE